MFVSTDSTSSHEFVSQFGLSILYTRKTPKNVEKGCKLRHGWAPSDPSNSDNMNSDDAVCVCVCVCVCACVCVFACVPAFVC